MRAGRTYAIGISVSYALLLLLLPASTDARTAGLVLSEALRAASWAVAGFGALSAARDLSARDHDDGSVSLANASGYRARDVLVSHWAAGAMRIAFWLFVPFALLALFAGVRFSTSAGVDLGVGLAAVGLVYAPLLGVTASTLAGVRRGCFPVTAGSRCCCSWSDLTCCGCPFRAAERTGRLRLVARTEQRAGSAAGLGTTGLCLTAAFARGPARWMRAFRTACRWCSAHRPTISRACASCSRESVPRGKAA